MPTDVDKFAGPSGGHRRRRRKRTTAQKLRPGPKAKRAARRTAPPRRSGGTSGNLTIPGYEPQTSVSTVPYRPSEPPTSIQRQIRAEAATPKTSLSAILGIPDVLTSRAASEPGWTNRAARRFPNLTRLEEIETIKQEEAAPSTLEALEYASLGVPGLGLGSDIAKLGELGVTGVAKLLGERGATQAAKDVTGSAAEKATSSVVKDALAKAGAKKAGAKAAVKQAVRDAEPEAIQQARERGRQFAHNFAARVPQGVKTGAKVAAQGATYPIRHPITAPIAAQIPTALIQGNPKALQAGFTGQGNYAGLLNTVGDLVSPVPLAKEALTLPSTVLPSIYLTGKAGLSAAKGDTSELSGLLKQWEESGLLPHLVEGDWSGALKAAEKHPLYSGLEASGALNAAGRIAGAGLRATPGIHVADVDRRPIAEIPGTRIKVDRGNYSPDLLRNLLQRSFDKSRWSEPKPGTHRATHLEKQAANRFSTDARRTEQLHAREVLRDLRKSLPKKKGSFGKLLDTASADVVHLAVERLVRNPESFVSDLGAYKELIDHAAEDKLPDGRPRLNREQMKRNRALSKEIERAIKHGKPSDVVDAADRFIKLQGPILEDLVDLKLIRPERAEMASAIPFARVHLGAGWGEPENLYRDLEHQIKTTRRNFRREARAHLAPPDEHGRPGGHVGAKREAERRLKIAESGYVESERGLARARQRHADADEIERRTKTRDAARQRVAKAKTEVRHATASLQKETRALAKDLRRRTKPLEGWLKQHRRNGEVLLDRHGYPLRREQIAAEMRDRGIEPPGFLSHRPPAAGDYYQPSFGGAGLEKGARSGESVLSGQHLGGTEALARQLRRSQGLVDRARAWNEAVSRFGIEIPGVKTWADAKRVMEDPSHHGLPAKAKVQAVPRYPFAATKDEIEGALAHQDPVGVQEAIGKHLVDSIDELDADKLPADTPVVFMPHKVVEQLREDAMPSGRGLKVVQAATNIFKRAVLVGAPSFYIGNAFDNYMRTLMAGLNPLDVRAAFKARNALSPERRAQIGEGAHYASVDKLAPHRSVEAVVTGGNRLAETIRDAAEWSHKHGWKQATVKFLPKAVGDLSHFLLAANAKLTEELPTWGLIGKQMRKDIRATQNSWMKSVRLSQQVVDEWAKGIDKPETRIAFQSSLEDTLGNYSQMSPGARKVLSNAVPFWTWLRSAYRYVYVTMPTKRSVQTGFLAALAGADQVEREQAGLEKYGKRPLPAWLQGGIPLSDGRILPTSQYSSFGYASDPLEAVSRASLAQFSNILESLKGRDYKGDPIEGEGERVRAALWGLAGSDLPGLNLLFRSDGGHVWFEPHVTLPHAYGRDYVEYEREPKKTITVPASGEESSAGGSGEGTVAGLHFAESWADRDSSSAGQSFAESWADR